MPCAHNTRPVLHSTFHSWLSVKVVVISYTLSNRIILCSLFITPPDPPTTSFSKCFHLPEKLMPWTHPINFISRFPWGNQQHRGSTLEGLKKKRNLEWRLLLRPTSPLWSTPPPCSPLCPPPSLVSPSLLSSSTLLHSGRQAQGRQ